MSKKRPLGITILAILVAIAAIVAIYHTLQFLHILPFNLGRFTFFAFDPLGAILWGLTALVLLWVVNALWNLKPEGWLFVVVMSIFDLILVFVSILGHSTFQAMLPAILINVLLLIYCFLPGVKAAFGQGEQPAQPVAAATAPPPPPAVRTMEAPPAAAVAVPAIRSTEVSPAAAAEVPSAPPPTGMSAQAPVMAAAMETPAAMDMPAEAPVLPPMEASTESMTPPPVEEAAAATAPASRPRPKVDIETIEGIGPIYAAKLKEIGIFTTADLLQQGASRKGREDLVEKSGLSPRLVLKWVNMADLMRISGVGEEYSELLEAAGVDTVKELKMRNPENLHAAMLQVNEQRNLVRCTPHLSEVQDWVEQAKQLEPVLTY
jgi:predicted flap endonuclease-1-like 5' DNA nuclease